MTKMVNIAELKDNLSAFIEAAQAGDEVVVCKRNRPVAKIVGTPLRKNKTKLGFDRRVKVLGDITGPAIPEEDWNMLRDDYELP